MLHVRGWAGLGLLVAVCGAGCAAPKAAGGGAGGAGGTAGTAGTGAVAGSAGTGGTGGTAAVAGYGATGGIGGWGGWAAVDGGAATGGIGGTAGSTTDGGDCPVGERCGPTGPDDPGCGTLTLEAEIEEIIMPGNLLVIFDRSGSMKEEWGGTPRYEVAGNALINALTPLQDSLTVGGVFFPSPSSGQSMCDCGNWVNWIPGGCCLGDSSCTVNTIDQPDQISFRPGAQFVAEVPARWQGSGGTPLQQAVASAAQALANAVYDGPMSVLIVTDGAPTCDSEDQPVLDQVTQWAAAGIKTYVVGLPGSEGARNLLNQIAMLGGTMSYIDPADAADLEMRLSAIVSSTVQGGFDSCSITLSPPAEVPDDLQLVVVENGMELEAPRVFAGNAGGWSVTPDGVNVELTGAFCDNAQAGTYTELRFKFGCVSLPPLPPPMPPD